MSTNANSTYAGLGFTFSCNGNNQKNGESGPDTHNLSITLSPSPSFEHFDPETLRLWLATHQNGFERRTLRHPWHGPEELRAGLGHILIRDRMGKAVNAFTFGGTLSVDCSPQATHCHLSSPAPIFDLRISHKANGTHLFCQRVEALLACRRASWIREPAMYFHRLATASPVDLYGACLKALTQPGRASFVNEGSYQQILQEEVTRLRSNGVGLDQIPELSALL